MEIKNPGFIITSVSAANARNCPGTVALPSAVSEKSKEEDWPLIKRALSAARFESHRINAAEDDERVFRRYQWNAAISERFYVPLQTLEVVLRNRFDEAISAKSKDPDWLTKVPGWLQENGRNDVLKAHAFLAERKRPLTQARVVQEMSFGFWTSLLNGKYETLFHAIGAQVFPGMPRTIRTRANASVRFESIRLLRNRIFHFRRIWNRPDLERDFNSILEAIEWVNPDARRLLLPSDTALAFQRVLSMRV
jgi:hypothetical protein